MFGSEPQWGSCVDNTSSVASINRVCKRKLCNHKETCKSTKWDEHANHRSHM